MMAIITTITITTEQRLIGCATFMGLGVLMSFMAFISFNDLNKFGLFYALGSIMAICSTLFLMGPVKQVQRMFDETRRIATIVFLLSLGFTLFCALYLKIIALTLIACLVQSCALFWYGLSYVPMGRAAFKKMVTGCFSS